jgi:hypothetical protein
VSRGERGDDARRPREGARERGAEQRVGLRALERAQGQEAPGGDERRRVSRAP